MPGDIGYSQLQTRENGKTKRKLLAWMTGKRKVDGIIRGSYYYLYLILRNWFKGKFDSENMLEIKLIPVFKKNLSIVS